MPNQRIATLLIPLALLSACPRVPVDFGKDGEAHSAQELLKRVALAETSVLTLKGEGKLFVDTPQGKGSVTIFVAVSHPALVHLEQLDFFGRPQSVLVTDGTQFGLYDAQGGQYLHGPATRATLGRFLPLVMPPDELAGLLLGRAPRIHEKTSELRFDDEQRVYVVTLHDGSATQTLTVRPPVDRIEKSTVSGFEAYDVQFGEVETYGAISFPKRAVLDAAKAKTHVELSWKDITLNEPADPTMFELAAPEGVPSLEVDEFGTTTGR
jgi:hypothetical protein